MLQRLATTVKSKIMLLTLKRKDVIYTPPAALRSVCR